MNVGPAYMDLINMAQANSRTKERELQRRQISNKDKKLNPKEVKLKVGVQKFLAKKEEEERRKREEANRKKQQLMELRNQDRKATSRVRRMINMTKSANKGVIAEARECLSEACIEQASETQPDEDDYGYTSTFANDMYNKMLQKYQSDAKKEPSPWSKIEGPKIHQLKKSAPSSGSSREPSSKNPSSTKHNHNNNNAENISNNNNSKETSKKPSPPKKKALPPPPAFDELLKLAELKSKEPIAIKKPIKESFDGPEFEFGRPMTAREKKTFLQEQALKQRAQAAFSGNQAAKASTGTTRTDAPILSNNPKSIPIPKLTSKVVDVPKPVKPQEPTTAAVTLSRSGNSNLQKREINNNNASTSNGYSLNSGGGGKYHMVDKALPSLENNNRHKSNGNSQPSNNGGSGYSSSDSRKHSSDEVGSSSSLKSSKSNNSHSSSRDTTAFVPPSTKASSGGISNHSTTTSSKQQRYSADNNDELRRSQSLKKRASSPPPMRSRPHPLEKQSRFRSLDMPPPPRRDKPQHKGRAIIESDEDYDSEMDDFIDDSDIPGEDISSMIGQMFGYNKRKYINEDSDDECMESSVEQQMREEARTLRLGVMEDLEDMKMEEEEKKRKAALLKKRKLN